MLRTSWKGALGRRVRLLMSAFAVVLGVAFVAGSLIFTDRLGSAFNGIMNGSVADVNVQPRGTADSLDSRPVHRELTAGQVEALRTVPGVLSASGTTAVSDVYLISKDGKAMAPMGGPAVGTNWLPDPAFGGQPGLVIRSGRPPQADGEAVIDPVSLDKGGYRLGDTMRIATSGSRPVIEATIVGTAVYGAENSTAGASYAFFTSHETQQLFSGGRDVWQRVWVVARDGVSPAELAGRLADRVPEGFEAVSGEQIASQGRDMIAGVLTYFNVFLLVFAGVALLVGCFLIVNTFSILVAQRSRELALLRALGASRAQVRGTVLAEAVIVGLVGSTLGVLAGFGLAVLMGHAFSGVGLEVGNVGMTLAPRTVLAGYAVGIVMTVFASLLPARRAGLVPPVAAMNGTVGAYRSELGRRLVAGVLLTTLGLAILLVGLLLEVRMRPAWVGGGAVLMLLGVSAASPVLGRPVIWGLGRLYARLFGSVGRLAELYAVRNPRRTAATASALMIGLTLVTLLASLGASAKASTDAAVRQNLRSDLIVQSVSGTPFSAAVADRITTVKGVQSVHRVRFLPARLDGQDTYLGAMESASFDRVVAQRLVAGDLSRFTGNAVLLSEAYARTYGLTVGSTVTGDINGRPVPLAVVGLFAEGRGSSFSNGVTTLSALAAAGVPVADQMLGVQRRPDADAASVQAGVQRAVADLPMVTVADRAGYAAAQAAQVDRLLGLLYGLLGLAIVIAVLGIVNTLALSVIERTREIGLLRAVGLGRGQLRRMIRLESVAIALLGSVLGVVMGLLSATALQRVMSGEGLTHLDIPVTQVVGFLAVAVLVGILAAVWPAFRAARLNVLDAISTE